MTEEKHPITFTTPNVLLAASFEDGVMTQTVREGGPKSFEATTIREEVNEPVEEIPLSIRATNRINFGDAVINVINDAAVVGDRRLVATKPTASEYMALIGKKVMVGFHCRRLLSKSTPEKAVYAVGRTFITLR